MARDANVGFELFDETARRRAAHRSAADDTTALRLEWRRMADHQEWAAVTHLGVAAHQHFIDFVLGEFVWRPERRDIRSPAAENSNTVDHDALAMQRDPFHFEELNHLALVEV